MGHLKVVFWPICAESLIQAVGFGMGLFAKLEVPRMNKEANARADETVVWRPQRRSSARFRQMPVL